MTQVRSNEDIFLELMQNETGDSSLSIEQAMALPLAKTLLRVIQQSNHPKATIAEPSQPVTPPVTEFSGRNGILSAAIEDTFDFSELTLDGDERGMLLESSDLVMIGGQRRLRLKDEKRAEILNAAMHSEAYRILLEAALKNDREQTVPSGKETVDLPSRWLRRFLKGDPFRLDAYAPAELRSALVARERLRLVNDLTDQVPSLEELHRRVALADLLEPLRLLVGARPGPDGAPGSDRFVGREEELKRLRIFVDEISSRSISEGLERGLNTLGQNLIGMEQPGIMVIQAPGGLGKSTLLAKFVLDHAITQQTPFPFAYLDFDRAQLDPRRPRQLLIEIARQVGLQFPAAAPRFNKLSESIRTEFVSATPNPGSASEITDPFASFVEVLREHATLGQRAFLLVLDTMEAVQWDVVAMEQLASLLGQFRVKGLDELKVVVSGRADVPELRRARGPGNAKNNRQLGPLQVEEARQMAQALGRAAIGDEWNPEWSTAVAGKKDHAIRREPLAVRVVVDLITAEQAEKRAKLVQEISELGPAHNQDFVARMYLKRVVNHVRHPLAEKLAWPGLIVRRLTEDIVRELLAPLCGLEPSQAQEAFEALGREGWMVTQEGDALRHRQDLRARTLPLMKSKDPEKFYEVVREAVAYFGKYQTRSVEDRAEWIYQRLLMGENPEVVAREVTDDILPLLGRAAEDFPPDSPAASYLASRTSTSRLSPPRIRNLRAEDALYHLSRTSAGVFALDDQSLDPVAQHVSRSITLDSELSPPLGGWARALWIKTGAWDKVAGQNFQIDWSNHQLLRTHLFWTVRNATHLPEPVIQQVMDTCREFNAKSSERVGVRSGAYILALARISGSNDFPELDRELAWQLGQLKPNPIPSLLAALRSTIVFGEESREAALKVWLAGRRRGTSERLQGCTISLTEIRALMKINPEAKEVFSNLTSERQGSPTRCTDPDYVNEADRFIEEIQFDSEGSRSIARLFACRDEDWIVPIGYAAGRAYGRPLSVKLIRSLEAYDKPNRKKQLVESATDMITIVRLADEAADLDAFVNLLLSECNPNTPETRELLVLMDRKKAWRQKIAALIGFDEKWEEDPKPNADILSRTLAKVLNVVGIAETNAPRNTVPVEPLAGRPPAPGPILHSDDPQKDRWGGRSQRDGREVRLVIDSVERDVFYFSAFVQSVDGTPLASPVVFHLHNSFPRSVITIRRVEDQQAALRSWNAYGVFAIGVQVKNSDGKWISLEIDLADAPGLPSRFKKR
jgi:hypothetical protein